MMRQAAAAAVLAGTMVFTGCAMLQPEPAETSDSEETTIEAPPKEPGDLGTSVEVEESLNVLILGSDARETGEAVAGERSDVVMLAHVSADRESVYVSSFPRDLYVEIPGHGQNRINAALGLGGLELAEETLEQYVGVDIDHTIKVGFSGVEDIVDSLGGITVDVPEAFTHPGTGTRFEGTMDLDGESALILARERKTLSGGDFSRNESQLAVLEGIKDKALSSGVLANPLKVGKFISALSEHLERDAGLSLPRMAGLAWELKDAGEGTEFFRVPHGDPFMVNGMSVVASDDAGMAKLSKAMQTGGMDEWIADYR